MHLWRIGCGPRTAYRRVWGNPRGEGYSRKVYLGSVGANQLVGDSKVCSSLGDMVGVDFRSDSGELM